MKTEIGEYIVGAYLKLIENCDFVDYNVRPPDGGLKGLGELDVIGINFKRNTVFLCEVTTHLRGLLYKNNRETIEKIKKKYERQKEYANEFLTKFENKIFMFWSPVVPRGYITQELFKINGLEIVINGEYKKRVEQLKELDRKKTYNTHNPFFRALQILEHLRE